MTTTVILMAKPWADLLPRLTDMSRGALDGVLALAIAVGIMLVGWGLAAVLSRVLRALLRVLRFDRAVAGVLGPHASLRHEPAGVAAWALYWLVIAGTALLALQVLGFDLAASVSDRLNEVVPRIVTSAVLFAVGAVIAMLVGGVTRRFLESADVRAARLQGQVVAWVLTGFAALLALEQLGFAAQFVMAVGIAVVAAAALGVALAFGLGCRELARDFVVEYLRSLDDEGPKRPQ
ncbi:MAG TPA: hypothetical protein VMH61_05015 [Candidatus Acidoferrales bacterium]|nr:hypothetical protein [Candidatus Acidoferrales bacterium]